MTFKSSLAKTLANVPLKRKFLIQTTLVALGIIALAVVAARMQYVDLTDTRRDGLKSQIEMAIENVTNAPAVDHRIRRATHAELPPMRSARNDTLLAPGSAASSTSDCATHGSTEAPMRRTTTMTASIRSG